MANGVGAGDRRAEDPRNERTRAAVKSALLDIMREKPCSQVGVSELARRAGVGRSTFYSHFSGVHDVFDALVDDFNAGTRTLAGQLRCGECADGRAPFCERLRHAGDYEALVRDPGYYAAAMRAVALRPELSGVAVELADAGLGEVEARAIRLFQASGCHAAALSVGPDDDWARVQSTIDRFVRGGLAALRAGR